MNKFGKEIYCEKYKKDALGMRKESLLQLLTLPDIGTEIIFIDNGKTDKGWEFATVRIYSKKIDSTLRKESE